MHKMLSRFHTTTVAEVFADPVAYNFYYEQEISPGISKVMLLRTAELMPDGTYEITVGADQHFTVAADQVLYYPPEN